MGDFSNKVISKISDIYGRIDLNSDTIILNSNCIKKAQLEILPDNIKNVYLDDNVISEISWDDRNWGVISIKNNNFETNEFSDLVCKKFFLDDNSIENITFSNCKFEELSISNNNIKSINFFDCMIKELNLSVNKITEIITLPLGLVKLNCYGNKIKNIFVDEFNNSITWIDLSDNKLESIGKLSKELVYLDLSKNKFKTFDTSILPENLYYFDITENDIPNNKELFGNLTPQKLFYDTDDDNDDDNNDESDLDSNASSDISVKLNKKFLSLNNNYKEFDSLSNDKETNLYGEFAFDEKDDIMNDEIANYIAEYKEQSSFGNKLSFTDSSSPFDSDFLNYRNSSDDKEIIQTNNQNEDKTYNDSKENNNNGDTDSDNLLSERDKLIRNAINHFRQLGQMGQMGQMEQQNQVKKKYSKTIPVHLQWNFNL
jgi:hypothetical protein